MNSARLPGKMLAPFRGRPMVDGVMEAAATAVEGEGSVVLLTSTAVTDDPLVAHAQNRGWVLFRGELDNVLLRYIAALEVYPCDWVVRVCGDSPTILPAVIKKCVDIALSEKYDIVTNVRPRTFPKGQSVEIIRSTLLSGIDLQRTAAEQREHVFPWFYQNIDSARIFNVACPDDFPITEDGVVDTLEDLRRLDV